jgi:hypothetical protein
VIVRMIGSPVAESYVATRTSAMSCDRLGFPEPCVPVEIAPAMNCSEIKPTEGNVTFACRSNSASSVLI